MCKLQQERITYEGIFAIRINSTIHEAGHSLKVWRTFYPRDGVFISLYDGATMSIHDMLALINSPRMRLANVCTEGRITVSYVEEES